MQISAPVRASAKIGVPAVIGDGRSTASGT
jgi:hypothetical protein